MASILESRSNGNTVTRQIVATTVTYGSTITLTAAQIKAYQTIFKIALTGALTLVAPTTGVLEDQVIEFRLTSDGTDRTVTYGTGFQAAGTHAIEGTGSLTGSSQFRFNGTVWVELCRQTPTSA